MAHRQQRRLRQLVRDLDDGQPAVFALALFGILPVDGYLYISMGDGGSGGDPGNRANVKTSKILRINVDNQPDAIPSDPRLWASVATTPFWATSSKCAGMLFDGLGAWSWLTLDKMLGKK